MSDPVVPQPPFSFLPPNWQNVPYDQLPAGLKAKVDRQQPSPNEEQ